MEPGDLPELYGYVSYRDFLRDWFAARKASDPRYSHRRFALRAGVRSPSLLNEVIAGRRNLSRATIEGFARALRLPHEQAVFFTDLVDFDQAETADDKNAAWARIQACRRFREARPIAGKMMRYLSHWYFPAVRELAWRADFEPDPQWVARALRPRISPAEARDALDTLVELGMLAPSTGKPGRLAPTEVSVATPHQLTALGAGNYHRAMLQRAADALVDATGAERHLCAVTVAIPLRLVDTLKAELDRFQERVLHLCDEQVSEAEVVYQVNLQLFPLSHAREP